MRVLIDFIPDLSEYFHNLLNIPYESPDISSCGADFNKLKFVNQKKTTKYLMDDYNPTDTEGRIMLETTLGYD